jgi:hypothetical protein
MDFFAGSEYTNFFRMLKNISALPNKLFFNYCRFSGQKGVFFAVFFYKIEMQLSEHL